MTASSTARLTLVIGGARSGKSRYAEALVAAFPPPWTYLATAEAFDDEMRERIAVHRHRRDERWLSVDVPLALPAVLRERSIAANVILVDCLTLWLSNIMLAGHVVEEHMAELTASLAAARCPVIVVSNEVGLGIVPDNALARRFRDAQGVLNMQVAAAADAVVLMTAGLPLKLKS